MTTTLEDHKATVRRFIDALNVRDIDTAVACLAEDFAFRAAPWAGGTIGRDGARRRLTEHLARFPDLHFELQDIFGEGDKVAIRRVWTATHTASLAGEVPTHRKIQGLHIEHWRFRDGRVAETWVCSIMPPEVTGEGR